MNINKLMETNSALSNGAMQLKMMELIVNINWQSFGHIVTYAGKLFLIFKGALIGLREFLAAQSPLK